MQSIANAHINCVPFNKASPSFAPRTKGFLSYSLSTDKQDTLFSLKITSPSPISGKERCARGARSPDAPKLPCSKTNGVIFSL